MTENTADRYRRLAAELNSTIDALSGDDLVRPTPCDGWTVADVIDHVVSTELDFLTERGVDTADTARDFPSVAAAMQSALDDPVLATASYDGWFGPTTLAETVDNFYCLDLVLHRWDIAAAVPLADHMIIDEREAERCQLLLAPMGDNVRMPGIFGPALDVADDASVQQRFLGWTGRDPSWSA